VPFNEPADQIEPWTRKRGSEVVMNVRTFSTAALALFFMSIAVPMQNPVAAEAAAPLMLAATIPLNEVSGRIDHMAFDRKRQRLIVAALGNNSVEVIDLAAGRRVQRITGLSEPQGVGYAEKSDVLFVANAGDGSVRMFQGADFSPLGRIDLKEDADNIRIDPTSGNVIVGFGNGGLAIIDPEHRTVIGTVSLPAHPEGFQIEPGTVRAFVNIPDAGQIAVVDLNRRRQIAAWKMPGASGNFPMALDAGNAVLAVVTRSPSRLVLLDTKTGNVTFSLPTCSDADDVFFDPKRARIYVSCGAGQVAIFQRDGERYRPLDTIATASGTRTSLFVGDVDRLFVAERAGLLGSSAALRAYQPTN
jgi:DNA-binding beta-propeller fold protein YncE